MQSRSSAIVVLALAASLAAGPARADSHEAGGGGSSQIEYREADRDPGWLKKSWDLVFMRPFDLVALGAGAVFWVIAYPVAHYVGGATEVTEACISFPFERTFQRPLGQL